MGKAVSKCCVECFTYSNEEEPATSMQEMQAPLIKLEEMAKPTETAEKVTSPNFFPAGYLDEKIGTAFEEFKTQVKNGMLSEGFTEITNKNNLQITTTEFSEGYYMKFQWAIPFTPEQFLDFIIHGDRKIWEKNIDEYSLVCWPDAETSVMHTKLKKVMIFSPRDILIASRTIRTGDGTFYVSTSVEHDDLSPSSNYVRAHLYVGGYFLSSIEPDEDGNITKVISITKGHPGGNISTNMIKKFISSNFPNVIKSQNEAIKSRIEKK